MSICSTVILTSSNYITTHWVMEKTEQINSGTKLYNFTQALADEGAFRKNERIFYSEQNETKRNDWRNKR